MNTKQFLFGTSLSNEKASEIAYLLFRFYIGISIALGAGLAKLPVSENTWFREQVQEIGFQYPSPVFWTHVAVWGEFVGGLLIAFGLFTRLSGLQLAFQFFVVVFIWYKEPVPFVGMYYQQLLFWGCILVMVKGGGRWSLDYVVQHFSFRRSKLMTAAAVLVFTALTGQVFADKPSKGNGNVVSVTKMPSEKFYQLDVQTYCNVEVTCGEMPKVEVIIDSNLQPLLEVYVENGALIIGTNAWLQPTSIKVKVSVPFLTKASISGWGNISIKDVETKEFSLNAETGHITLTGDVETLNLIGGTGTINATSLAANSVNVKQDGHGLIKVNAQQSLQVTGKPSNVVYLGSPVVTKSMEGTNVRSMEKAKQNAQNKPRYFTFTVKNNTWSKLDCYIEGPSNSPFSYGFPIGGKMIRRERAPVGTKIYEVVDGNERGKLLLEVTAGMEGKTIKLVK
jgi:uncharacterized membrane protein YphA (DoxX/SURF4 family)